MLIGHVAIGFAGKKFAPKTSIGASMFAAILIDLFGAVFAILGIESAKIVPGITAVYPLDLEIPWSHSLTTALLLSVLVGGIYFLVTKYRRGAVWLMLAVISHWVLDFISHIPDLPLWPHGPKVGLGLWMSLPTTIAVEGSLFAVGVFLYWRSTLAKRIWGHIALWLPVSLLICAYIASFTSPPPSSADMLGRNQLFLFLMILLFGYWMDRTRSDINPI